MDILSAHVLIELVREGLRVGKNPWCCCGMHQTASYKILNAGIDGAEYDQETAQETIIRRELEELGVTYPTVGS